MKSVRRRGTQCDMYYIYYTVLYYTGVGHGVLYIILYYIILYYIILYYAGVGRGVHGLPALLLLLSPLRVSSIIYYIILYYIILYYTILYCMTSSSAAPSPSSLPEQRGKSHIHIILLL